MTATLQERPSIGLGPVPAVLAGQRITRSTSGGYAETIDPQRAPLERSRPPVTRAVTTAPGHGSSQALARNPSEAPARSTHSERSACLPVSSGLSRSAAGDSVADDPPPAARTRPSVVARTP